MNVERITYIKVEFCEKSSSTMETGEPLVALMDLNVLIQVGFLCEWKVTTWIAALVRSLVGVNSQMIKEIVPFSKNFATLVVSAAKKPYHPSSFWASVLCDHEFLRLWNVFVYTNKVKIKFLAILDYDLKRLWQSFVFDFPWVFLNVEFKDVLDFLHTHNLERLLFTGAFVIFGATLVIFAVYWFSLIVNLLTVLVIRTGKDSGNRGITSINITWVWWAIMGLVVFWAVVYIIEGIQILRCQL